MAHHEVRVLPDGTRVYSNHTRYVPVPDEKRAYARRKPAVEGAVRVGGTWFLPLDLAPPEAREWPETRPDTDAYEHMSKARKCRCRVCLRPEAQVWRERWYRDHGIRL